MAVDALRLCLDEDALAVGTHGVALHPADSGAVRRAGIEEHAHLLARTERVLHYLLAVGRNLGIAFAVGQGHHGRNALTTELSVGDVLQ